MTPLGSLIHDSNHYTSDIELYTEKLNRWIKDNFSILSGAGLDTGFLFSIVEHIRSNTNKIEKAQDKYYVWAEKENGQKLF